ncbi:hypothetical protein BGZ65_011784 [Modicella reniformis]|uniref:Uncharacterized protein n=1 Tax=Modicella reniformis TaxID=1440133 RepID=A0A9P6SUL9_9FUNG|nr:hypothetical protein BGZ65_011784 [Modicella reniformis]
MNRSRSSAGPLSPPTFWRRDDKSTEPADSEDSSEEDETNGDFDTSIHLSEPFQLLLISTRFADAAVQALWRNLVFHGRDTYQMEALLSTLLMEDGLSDRQADHEGQLLYDLGKVRELAGKREHEDKDQDGNEDASEATGTEERDRRCARAEKRSSVDGDSRNSNDDSSDLHQPHWQTNEESGTRSSWIESWKQIPRFQESSTGGHRPRIENATRQVSSVGGMAQKPGYMRGPSITTGWGERTRTGRARSSSGMKPHQARWSYRRYVRRVVLNFSHPQASAKMLVKVLECLQSQCPDQILALDVHVNEKMRSAGLEKTEVLERLFGSRFSKLRYLRLQGGFVDNQLLYALIKGLGPSEPVPRSDMSSAYSSIPPVYSVASCRLSQVFLGPGSVTDSAVEKLIAAAGHSLEVFAVTSCVDIGGGALADLLTRCPKLRVLGVHRSLARDRDLLEGLGIEIEAAGVNHPLANPNDQSVQGFSGVALKNPLSTALPPRTVRKTIVAPLERLELGMVKLTRVSIAEILKGTCGTLRFLVLETQHFSEGFLTEVITPYCTRLEGLYFDDPEQLQRQQQLMQGLGFSAGRRGAHLPKGQFDFGRVRRTFYSDPNRPTQDIPSSQQRQQQQQEQSSDCMFGTPSQEQSGSSRFKPQSKVSAWLGETSTEEWIAYGDCALWTSAASPSVSFENGGFPSGGGQGMMAHQHPRRQPLPYHHAYHNPIFMASMPTSTSTTATPGFNPHNLDQHYHNINHNTNLQHQYNPFLGDYDDVLQRFRVTRGTVENMLQTLRHLVAFTVMHMDFIQESQGISEWKALMRQDELWLQSTGFRALQVQRDKTREVQGFLDAIVVGLESSDKAGYGGAGMNGLLFSHEISHQVNGLIPGLGDECAGCEVALSNIRGHV